MGGGDSRTYDLLQRWHQGDSAALNRLLEKNLPFIRNYLRGRLGPLLRQKGESMDYVQDAMVEFLRYGPRFVLTGEATFRALMIRIIENVLRDRHDWFTARRRDLARERPLPVQSVLGLDPSLRKVTAPSEAAQRQEEEGWIRLALELLRPQDREVIHLRIFDQADFKTIGAHFGIDKVAARARFLRALPRLARIVEDLRAGRLEKALGHDTDRARVERNHEGS
jgi:RNA polymerase sigma-70 factor, ECF subfamily